MRTITQKLLFTTLLILGSILSSFAQIKYTTINQFKNGSELTISNETGEEILKFTGIKKPKGSIKVQLLKEGLAVHTKFVEKNSLIGKSLDFSYYAKTKTPATERTTTTTNTITIKSDVNNNANYIGFSYIDDNNEPHYGYIYIQEDGKSHNFKTGSYAYEQTPKTAIVAGATERVVLPVEFVDVNAELQNRTAEISWSTASEENNEKFVIEHSTNGTDFTAVSEIAGAGYSTDLLQYSFLHEETVAGNNYYRIKQVDFDGAFDYSDIVVVYVEPTNENQILVYPNPFADRIYIQSETLEQWEILDTQGRTILTGDANEIDVLGLNMARGHYIFRAKNEGEAYSSQLIYKNN